MGDTTNERREKHREEEKMRKVKVYKYGRGETKP